MGAAGFGAVGLGASTFAGSLRGSSSAVPMPCRALSSFRRRSSSRPAAGSASSEAEEAYRRTPRALTGAAGRGRTPERIRSAGVGTREAARAEEAEPAASEPALDSAPAPGLPPAPVSREEASRAVASGGLASTLCSAAADTPGSAPDSAPGSGRGEAPPRARCVAAAIRARGLEATGRTPCSTETSPEPRPLAPRPSDSAGRGTTRPNQPR